MARCRNYINKATVGESVEMLVHGPEQNFRLWMDKLREIEREKEVRVGRRKR
ncbi:MAG: hypothetical protein ACXABY_36430 [Candidatus Thorarchaeota archaeon]